MSDVDWSQFKPADSQVDWSQFKPVTSGAFPDSGQFKADPGESFTESDAQRISQPTQLGDALASIATRYTPLGLLPQVVGGGGSIVQALANASPDISRAGAAEGGIDIPEDTSAKASPADVAQTLTQAMAYEPQTAAGKAAAAPADYAFGKLGELADKAGDKTLDFTGSPAAAAAVNTAAQILPFVLGERAVKGAGSVRDAVRQANVGDAGFTGDLSGFDRNPMAPSADTLKATESATPNTPQDQATKAALSQDMADVQQATATPPSSPLSANGPASPPPEVAAALDKASGGDPKKAQAIIEQATQGKLLPGENPEDLANAALEKANESPQDRQNAVVGAEKPPTVSEGAGTGGEGTGVAEPAPEHAQAVIPPSPATEDALPAENVPAAAGEAPVEAPKTEIGNPPENFTPEQRRESAVQAMQSIPGLTEEQKQGIAERYPQVTKDRVFGFNRPEELEPTIRAAQDATEATGKPSSYGELDVRNLGGLNDFSGSPEKADAHLKALSDILNQDTKVPGAHIELGRKSLGDELSVVAHGLDKNQLSDVLAKSQGRINEYSKANGLSEIPHPKGKEPGFGLHYGTADIEPGRPVSDIIDEAGSLVEARKKGAPYEQRASTEPVGGQPSAGTSAEGGVAGNPPEPFSEVRPSESGTPEASTEQPRAEQSAESTKPAEPIGVKNESIRQDRISLGVDELVSHEGPTRQELFRKAVEDAQNEPERGQAIAADIVTTKRGVKQEDVAALLADRVRISREYKALSDRFDKAETPGEKTDALVRLDQLEQQRELNELASRVAGTEASWALSARQMLSNEDYSLVNQKRVFKIANDGKELPAHVEKQLKAATDRIAELEEKLTQAQEKQSAPRVKKTPDQAMQERVKKQLAKLEGQIKERLASCPL